ncbi:unnamed protein product, partial [Penicillium egyptiacum]
NGSRRGEFWLESDAHVRGAGEVGVEALGLGDLAGKVDEDLPAHERLLGVEVEGGVQNLALTPEILCTRQKEPANVP